MVRRLLIGGIFLALPMAMLYPLWRSPTSAGEDDVIYYYPLRMMVAQQVRAGQWPVWNPHEAGGVPLFGDPQSGLFYPANLLFLLLPGKLAYSLAIFLAFTTAGVGAYVYLRRIGLARPAAAFGSVAFMFSGFMVGHRVHLSLIQAAALLPWGLWSIELVRRSALAAAAAMTAAFALMLAAGHWPTAVHVTLAWGAYLLLRGRPFGRAALAAGAAVVLGVAMLAPQIAATAQAVRGTIRSGLPYAVAGENSFFPLASVLAFFPFIMGCRTPNVFSQGWWGPWHLCEMLGYVGLVTLPLAWGAIRRLRKTDAGAELGADVRPVARAWTLIVLAAGVWALGSYLPTYRLIHMLPVVGMVRCPARMLLVIDLGLAALAAAAIHSLMSSPPAALRRTVGRAVTRYLPLCMAGCLVVLAALYVLEGRWWRLELLLSRPAETTYLEAWARSLNPLSPAVWAPVVLAVVTILAVRWFLAAPRRRAWVLTVVLLADLFLITRFVDVPGAGQPLPDPDRSPAAAWLRSNTQADDIYRVWSPSDSYYRPIELLSPKACATLGFDNLSYYGPFQPAEHARLFGFRSWGENYEWDWLIRRNYLLSLFNVRFILAADPDHRRVIESVRVRAEPPAAPGPDQLADRWELAHGQRDAEGVRLRKPLWSLGAYARQPLTLIPGRVYRISLEARAPDGAGNSLCAEWDNGTCTPARLRIDYKRLGPNWRRFERTFRVPQDASGPGQFILRTASEKLIEVRNVSLGPAEWETPINLGGRLGPGDAVYVDRTPNGLPPLKAGDSPVHIYENQLYLPRHFPIEEVVEFENVAEVIEAMRWRVEEFDLTRQVFVARTEEGVRGGMFTTHREYLTGKPAEGSLPANGMGALVSGQGIRASRPWEPWVLPQLLALGIWLIFVLFGVPKMNMADRLSV